MPISLPEEATQQVYKSDKTIHIPRVKNFYDREITVNMRDLINSANIRVTGVRSMKAHVYPTIV